MNVTKVHEYQAKQILSRFGVQIPKGEIAYTPDRSFEIARMIGRKVALKAQVHAGGRGKGGGIQFAKTPEEAKSIAQQMLGMTLITSQTGPQGKKVRKILVEEAFDLHKELYIGIIIDRDQETSVIIVSSEGGIEIEQLATQRPEVIFKEYINPATGLLASQARNLSFKLGLDGDTHRQAIELISNLYKAFECTDASMVEINPLVITSESNLVAIDAKMIFDDNALFRHPEIQKMRDLDEEDPLEVEASRFGLNYIKLDGNIGCMVNGAGLAMATMDIIKYEGGMPANFLDVGGGVSEKAVKKAFKILVSDKDVKSALINIFGGIVRCDLIANGIVKAAKEIRLTIPMVVRIEGTNANIGKKILNESGMLFYPASSMKEAAIKVVSLAK
ncbi:MAG: ADP-forming succinate--CoA ligase subunit beta [Acidobacteriota bacterium]|nr:ADP-forming succinate--CoA ligase subunit beta [Acidobacteriota bacterium]